jgi:hypothetical protein
MPGDLTAVGFSRSIELLGDGQRSVELDLGGRTVTGQVLRLQPGRARRRRERQERWLAARPVPRVANRMALVAAGPRQVAALRAELAGPPGGGPGPPDTRPAAGPLSCLSPMIKINFAVSASITRECSGPRE